MLSVHIPVSRAALPHITLQRTTQRADRVADLLPSRSQGLWTFLSSQQWGGKRRLLHLNSAILWPGSDTCHFHSLQSEIVSWSLCFLSMEQENLIHQCIQKERKTVWVNSGLSIIMKKFAFKDLDGFSIMISISFSTNQWDIMRKILT